MYKQQGIALIQVILITSMVLLLTIFFSQLAKSQVQQAQLMADRLQAFIELKNIKSEVLATLLSRTEREIKEKGWNQHGKAITLHRTMLESPTLLSGQASLNIQDLNGLMTLYNLTGDRLLTMLITKTMPEIEAKPVAQAIVDWVDSNNQRRQFGAEQADYGESTTVRNGTIQHLNELNYVRGVTAEMSTQLNQWLSLQPRSSFNPMTAPSMLLDSYLTLEGKEIHLENILALRDSGQLTTKAFTRITGLSVDEEISLTSGPGYRLQFRVEVNQSTYSEQIEVLIKPYSEQAITLLNRQPLS